MQIPPKSAERTGVPVPPLLVYGAGVGAGWLLGRLWAIPVPGGDLLIVTAVLWMLAGLGLALWGAVVFRRAGTTVNPFGGTSSIVATGPYRYTRNPMYVGFACIQFGLGLALREGWILILLVPVIVIIDRFAVRREEQYLGRKHGDDWITYAQRVRRWL